MDKWNRVIASIEFDNEIKGFTNPSVITITCWETFVATKKTQIRLIR